MDLRLDDLDPRIRDLAYLLFLEEVLGGEWVERVPAWPSSRPHPPLEREYGSLRRVWSTPRAAWLANIAKKAA